VVSRGTTSYALEMIRGAAAVPGVNAMRLSMAGQAWSQGDANAGAAAVTMGSGSSSSAGAAPRVAHPGDDLPAQKPTRTPQQLRDKTQYAWMSMAQYKCTAEGEFTSGVHPGIAGLHFDELNRDGRSVNTMLITKPSRRCGAWAPVGVAHQRLTNGL
jgi:hypothetical protein